ncbi:MAG: DUF2318 domain-containing protein [Calditerrivibrio sp.]|nr:DUF2318 domain-containing protein [Calditerrivibrio sp.]
MKNILLLILVLFMFGFFGGKYKTVKESNGTISIPIKELETEKASFYRYKVNDKDIKFFAIKLKDGSIRTAFDACEICYPAKKGYSQQGEFMICNNCGLKFHQSKIGVIAGGCNPSPLKSTITKDQILISTKELITHYKYF